MYYSILYNFNIYVLEYLNIQITKNKHKDSNGDLWIITIRFKKDFGDFIYQKTNK